MKTYCNPLDLAYRYQHTINSSGHYAAFREGADPTLVYFKGTYYLFASMSAGFWYSDNLIDWKFHENTSLLMYDYAPDVRQWGDKLIFCASSNQKKCPFLVSKNPLEDDFEEIPGTFPFWDPNVFVDDDGRIYLYWGCTNSQPIYGCELDQVTMKPLALPIPLIFGNPEEHGFERPGENGLLKPDEAAKSPFIEGAYMTKYNGKYYLQYACPGTEFNIYGDGVYVSDEPLGKFVFQASNPFSSKPGGFCRGAGHGSTIQDKYGNWWHASTMGISVNHMFERRIGLFPAGFDQDGVLFCNQNFSDYPMRIPKGRFDPWTIKPEWMLLSYKKAVTASSWKPHNRPENAVNEDIRSCWSAQKAGEGEWLCVDLGDRYSVHGIQINFADGFIMADIKDSWYNNHNIYEKRYIETRPQPSLYKIEISTDKEQWILLENVLKEGANVYFEYLEGISARYIRVVCKEMAYQQAMSICGLRVFGKSDAMRPRPVKVCAARLNGTTAKLYWDAVPEAQGYNVRYGIAPDKLYMNWMVYDQSHLLLPLLVKDQAYFIRVDAFNEGGITEGRLERV